MKQIALLAFTILLISGAKGQNQVQSNSVTIGTKHKLKSHILNEEREYWVSLPADYYTSKYTPAKYPVVYLLDGDANFHSFTGMVQALSSGAYSKTPQMIVVGILNTDRTRDLTPSASSRAAFFDKSVPLYKNSGGNALFIRFLENELIPHIDSSYRTDDYKILTGHSFGGLTAVNILLNHTSLFNAYIAIDPSLWWDNSLLLKQADSLFKKKEFKGAALFTGRAFKESVPEDTTTDMPRSNIAFHQLLDKYKPAGLKYKHQYYANDDHGTIPVPASYDALKFIFREHRIHVKQAVKDPSLVTKSFERLSKDLHHRFSPSESWLDWMGSYCLKIGKPDKASDFFRMAAELYPDSPEIVRYRSKIREGTSTNYSGRATGLK